MVSKETIQIIESVYNNFREDRLQNVNENLTLCLHSNEKFFKDRIKRNYKHANNLRKLYIKGLRDKNYNKDNKDTTSIIRVVYKEFSTANIILEDLRRIKDFFPNDLVSVYLVSTNDVTDCCDTHRKIENKIKSIIGGGKSLHLNINEISINHDSENAKNISEILRKNTEKNAIFNILIMIKHEVRYLSDFFALLSFKQYSKRPDSYVSKQYGKLKDDEPNNFKYCMNVIFKKHSFGTLPRFNTELKFPIRFYSINSNEDKLGSSSPMMDNVSVVSNDTLIPDVNEINEGNSGLLSPSIQSEATIVCSESDDVNKMNTDLDLESCMNIIDNIDSFQFSSLQNENQSIINESNDMKAILPNTDLPTVLPNAILPNQYSFPPFHSPLINTVNPFLPTQFQSSLIIDDNTFLPVQYPSPNFYPTPYPTYDDQIVYHQPMTNCLSSTIDYFNLSNFGINEIRFNYL